LSAEDIGRRANTTVVLAIIESEAARSNVPPELKNVEALAAAPGELATLAETLRARNKPTEHLDELDPVCEFLRRNNGRWLRANTGLLARSEQLKLLRERLEFWIERPDGLTNIFEKVIKTQNLSILMQQPIFEFEIILRGAKDIVALRGMTPRFHSGLCDADWQQFVDLAELAAQVGDKPHLSRYWEANEAWLLDFLLKPLLGAVLHKDTAARASAAYRLLCGHIRTADTRKEARVYLDVLREVSSAVLIDDQYWDSVTVQLLTASCA